MNVSNMIYDIRTTEYAQQTLVNLSGVPISIWEHYVGHEDEYRYIDDLVEHVINCHGHLPSDYRDFEFIYFHITTSANKCLSFRKHGILDLKQSYLCHDSELREFLEKHDIHIELDKRMLTYCGKEFDITFGDCPSRNTEAYKRWSVGRKFYYDHTTCGFLSVWERSPYGGEVHLRPEILMNIDNLLGLTLSQEWVLTHHAFEVIAKVRGEKIVYDGDEHQTDKDKVLNYLTKAYLTAFGEPSEEIILIKDDIMIPPLDILEIKPMEHWME